ncbi:MAG: GDP-mannose 4,6-dehydratase [Candidatus Peribacteraceae bacterium]|nr:GDP-mannose 4,6-dehydratase [Candidatus Peribacteraceae bacterium]
MAKKALITGITGQDGSYLAEFLISKGYEVHGLVRRSSSFNRHRIESLFDVSKRHTLLHYGDMTDINSLINVLGHVCPDEVYNLAAQSHVRVSFDVPSYTAQADAVGVQNLMEAIRILDMQCKIYQASTSELYSGDIGEAPQNELTRFRPRSPYGVAKLYGYETTRIYREAYGFFACNGILFNHESPRRGVNFVTRKITKAAVEIHNGTIDCLYLGNLNAKRDWGYAPEYVESMYLMLQQPTPDDYVVSTGETHSVRDFAECAFEQVGMNLEWEGSGLEEKGINTKSGKVVVKIDPEYFRPNEVEYLCGDASKAKKQLKWEPKVTFSDLVSIMMDAELKGEATP